MSDIKQLISIIIPVYNESESIGFLLDEVINVMSLHKFNFELIVVNDGSKDNTQQVLKKLKLYAMLETIFLNQHLKIKIN